MQENQLSPADQNATSHTHGRDLASSDELPAERPADAQELGCLLDRVGQDLF